MREFISKKVGIVGGGQLGKMILSEATRMGIYTVVLDPNRDCPAGCLANELITASFDDKTALKVLADKVDVITYEFEHISVEALKELEEDGYTIYPSVRSLEIIQNKYSQKLELKKYNIPIGDFKQVNNTEDIREAAEEYKYPIMLKSALGGYDGKGNSLIGSKEDIKDAFLQLGGGRFPLYIEKFVPFTKEISVLCCRGIDGEVCLYPVAENIHKDSILFETSVPASISRYEESRALETAKKVCEAFEGVGMFCVEMFLTATGEVLVNEVAPRPHNSGHYTIEGCVTSQYENHIRAIIGLPLGDTSLLKPSVMRNLLGEKGHEGKAEVLGVYEALSIPEVYLHIYGKKETKPQRKMGHITATGASLEDAKRKVAAAHSFIKIIAK